MKKLTCLRCRHRWLPRQEVVRICPKCKSHLWNIASVKDRILKYDGKYGKLIINLDTHNIDDQLNRDKIWADANEDYTQQQIIYSQILAESGIDKYSHPTKANQLWNGEETDFGFKAILDDSDEVVVDSEGVFIST